MHKPIIEDETFKTVYVYSVSDSYIPDTTDYLVGYTGDNFPTLNEPDSNCGSNYNHWPSVSGGKETLLPWTLGIGNTVKQAWDWNDDVAKDTSGNYYYTDDIQSANRGWAWNAELSSS